MDQEKTETSDSKQPASDSHSASPREVLENESEKSKIDGGLMAWLQCLAGFCIFFYTWGLLNSFGVYQTFYSQSLLSSVSESTISWIGTIQACIVFIGTIYAAILYDLGYLRLMITIGSLCVVLGVFLTSISSQYWHFLLAQGFLVGIGMGSLFFVGTGLIASWFTEKRGLALGLASSGSAIGGILYSVMFVKLQPEVGFGWYTRIVGFITLFLSCIPILFSRYKIVPVGVRHLFKWSLYQEAEYTLFAASLTIGYLGLYVPYFYLQLYAVQNTTTSSEVNDYLIAIINSGGLFGRLALGALGDKTGPLNAFIISGSACAILIYGWLGITSQAGLLAFAVLYGFFSAGLIILPATVVAHSLCPDIREYPLRVSMLMPPAAIGILIGNPIAGALLSRGWDALRIFSATCVVAGTVLAISSRFVKFGLGLNVKC